MARPASEQGPGEGTRFGDGLESLSGRAARDAIAIGSVIDGKYRVEGLLGEGGMGSVWWAHHLQLDRPVAIKLLRPGSDRVTLSERLKIEARAAARLVHPAIVRVFDIDTSDAGEPYIVMELLKGESLADLLDRGRVSSVHAVQLALPIAEGLTLAHAEGVVHRDLKPHNVFLAEESERLQPKLLDFGVAKLVRGPEGSLTETGATVGSPDYMSPEQARGSNDVDYRADIWAFSVLLYEAVSGELPFSADNYNALMRSIVEDEPRPLVNDETIDPVLADLIMWGLNKDRAERPQSIHELGRELARWLLDRGVQDDVCGTLLGPKWITRVSQKSVPVLPLTEISREPTPAPSRAAAPPSVVRGDTLVSPRHPSLPQKQPEVVESRLPPVASPRRVPWAVVLVLLLGAGGTAWFWGTRPSPAPAAGAASPALLGPPSATPRSEAEPRSEPAPPLVQIAPSAPSPPEPTARATPPRPRDNVNSAPLGTASLKSRESKALIDAPKPSSASKPASDAHDEARELLQAY
ncbi:MAG TPA: serine/threonine-protein kinase [Polyangiaceae bacterium]|nr:serine/threonine-protein kinase [Polyangiaceae bacterium]